MIKHSMIKQQSPYSISLKPYYLAPNRTIAIFQTRVKKYFQPTLPASTKTQQTAADQTAIQFQPVYLNA